MWVELFSIGKAFGKIIIPINHNKHSLKLAKGKPMSSILLSKDKIFLRYENKVNKKIIGKIVGADSGISSVITLSDNQHSKNDLHNHSLNSILNKIKRKNKGSKAFYKALEHRNNFINWSINQLNLSDIRQINLEKVSNFRYKKNVGKFLNYSGEALIRQKLIDKANELGVQVHLQSSPFRSQRCSSCGYVSSKNRVGKLFSCKHCSFQADADLNASSNHEQSLPSSWFLLKQKDCNKKFFWKVEGFFDLDGQELTVPATNKGSYK